MQAINKPLHCGALARMTGVSPDTIRHYERVGVLPACPRSFAGYRMYPPDAIVRVRLARAALQLGFTLPELAEILKVRDGGGVPCHRVLRLTEEKLRSLRRQIDEMRETERYMRKVLSAWRHKLGQTQDGSKALLLQSLIEKPLASAAANEFKGRKRK